MAQLSSMRLIWLMWVESRLKECLNKVVCVLKNKKEERRRRKRIRGSLAAIIDFKKLGLSDSQFPLPLFSFFQASIRILRL
jgi:hypothetical protein